MFEGKPLTAHHALHADGHNFADEGLTAFSWDDLIARLCAAQDLRAALQPLPEQARASFDSLAAQLKANGRNFAAYESKSSVNPVASVKSKGDGARDGSWADEAQSTFRGIA